MVLVLCPTNAFATATILEIFANIPSVMAFTQIKQQQSAVDTVLVFLSIIVHVTVVTLAQIVVL
jgi:hypothetical protein